MIYDQFFIEDLKNRADLLRLIEPYTELRKKGSNWMGRCPFHEEKTASFSVQPTKGFYKCFGCGKGGNAFTFVMETEGLSFPDAVRRVAEASGVPLPEPVDDESYQRSKKKREEQRSLAESIVALNRIAVGFWESELQQGDQNAKAARAYLQNRGISPEIQRTFKIGFSPDSWDSLLERLRKSGTDEGVIKQSGLVSTNDEKTRVFDRFRGRIMFPILDVNGDPIAFGARAMGDEQPKYLNSPETPAYTKGRHLYGLFQSRESIRRRKFAILVEGYLDLIALYQFGITNVVASLGTAFTPEQSRLLGRFTKKAVINYDGDTAGIAAARRAVDALLGEDFDIKILILPDGQDPDDFIRSHDAEAYNKLRGNALPFLQFVINNAIVERNLNIAHQKADAVSEVLPVVSMIRNPIQKRESFDQVMNGLRIDDNDLRRSLWNTAKHGPAPAEEISRQVERTHLLKITVAEQQLLELLVYDRELRDRIFPLLEETDYEALATAPVFKALMTIDAADQEPGRENLFGLAGDDPVAEDFIPMLLMSEPKRVAGEEIDEVLHDAQNCVFSLRSMAISNRILEISQELLAAEQANEHGKVAALAKEQIELTRLRSDLLTKLTEK